MRTLLRLVLILASLLVSLGLAEAFFRRQESSTDLWLPMDEPGRLYALKPNGDNTNSQGFNERELPLEKPPDTWRVVVMGDSVTFGGGVAREEAYPRVAEAILRERGLKAEIINLAVYGYDADQVAATLQYRGWLFHPDLVVYAAYTNDGNPTELLRLGDTHTPIYIGGTDSPVGAFFLRHSAIARRVMGAAHSRRAESTVRSEAQVSAMIDGAMARMSADAEAHGVPLLVFGLVAHVLADPNPETCAQSLKGAQFCAGQLHTLRLIGELARARGLPFAQILPALRGGPERDFYLPGPEDPHHPNAAGHARIGALLADVLMAYRDGSLDSLEASTIPAELIDDAAGRPASERKPKGVRPPKNPNAGRPRRSETPARNP